jgi:hypothetical protein
MLDTGKEPSLRGARRIFDYCRKWSDEALPAGRQESARTGNTSQKAVISNRKS